jgi:MYXO-CTERM domain-containing protein
MVGAVYATVGHSGGTAVGALVILSVGAIGTRRRR